MLVQFHHFFPDFYSRVSFFAIAVRVINNTQVLFPFYVGKNGFLFTWNGLFQQKIVLLPEVLQLSKRAHNAIPTPKFLALKPRRATPKNSSWRTVIMLQRHNCSVRGLVEGQTLRFFFFNTLMSLFSYYILLTLFFS